MKTHGVICSTAIFLALAIGWLDYETHSWKILFCNNGNLLALLMYTAIFVFLGYFLVWLFKKR